MSGKSAPLFSALLTLVALASAHATPFNLISADRTVSVTDTAGASNGSTTAADSQSGTAFTDFHGNVSKSAQWMDPAPPVGTTVANSSASQDSAFSATQWTVNSHLSFSGSGSLPNNFNSFLNSDAASFYQTTFSVSAPTGFNLNYSFQDLFSIGGTLDLTTTLSSNISGTLVDLQPNSSTGSVNMTGLLSPGEIYVLTFAQHLNFDVPDPLGQEGQMSAGLVFNFTSVPDQGEAWSLTIGVVSLAGLRLRFSRQT